MKTIIWKRNNGDLCESDTMDGVSEQIHDVLDKLPGKAIQNLLISALSEMEGNNAQSKTAAICHAVGAKEIEGDQGAGWELPKLESIQHNFSW